MVDNDQSKSSIDFQHYPLGLGDNGRFGLCLRHYSRELKRNSANLFVHASADCKVAIWQRKGLKCDDGEKLSLSWLHDLQDLKNNLKPCLDTVNMAIMYVNTIQRVELIHNSVIHRKNSWSRMKILPEMFKYLCTSIEIHPQFLNLVFGFGYRTSSADDTSITFYNSSLFKAYEDPLPRAYDVSFNLRFFERHGRDLADPWSCRQSAIYQKFLVAEMRSIWVVIHEPQLFQDTLGETSLTAANHPLSIHLWYIRSATYYWRDYLKFRSSEIHSLDAKLSIPKPHKECEPDFVISQSIQAIRKKLNHAISILEGTQNVLKKLLGYGEEIGNVTKLPSSVRNVFRIELEQVSNEMKSHIRVANGLLRHSKELLSTSKHILALNNQVTLIQNGVSVAELTQLGTADNRVILRMADKTRQDSRTMRIATVVAIVYLPANLVMSFFSTSLVEFANPGQLPVSNLGGHMVISSHVWVVFLSSIVLAVATMAIITLWDRRGRSFDELASKAKSSSVQSGDRA